MADLLNQLHLFDRNVTSNTATTGLSLFHSAGVEFLSGTQLSFDNYLEHKLPTQEMAGCQIIGRELLNGDTNNRLVRLVVPAENLVVPEGGNLAAVLIRVVTGLHYRLARETEAERESRKLHIVGNNPPEYRYGSPDSFRTSVLTYAINNGGVTGAATFSFEPEAVVSQKAKRPFNTVIDRDLILANIAVYSRSYARQIAASTSN